MADFVALFQETAETIRARIDADANSGLADTDPDRIDTREGTFYYDVTQAIVLELARIWDALGGEVPAAALPVYAWGDYLDDHAATFGLERKAGTQATSRVQISGAANLLVGQGTIFTTNPATADAEPIEFETSESLVLSDALAVPEAPAVSASSDAGFTEAGTYYYFVSAVSEWGETQPSPASEALAVDVDDEANLAWAGVDEAIAYSIYRGTSNVASEATLIGTASTESFTDTGLVASETLPNSDNRSACGEVSVRAVETGIAGNVSVNSIVVVANSDPDIYSVNNPDAALGGAEVESDEDLRTRLLAEYTGFAGAGTIADYKRRALEFPGIGNVFVKPVWDGGGTVLVAVADSENNAVQDTGTVANGNLVLALQETLDPTRLDSGTGVVASSTVTDASKSWVTDQWVGKSVILGNKYAVIESNTDTELTITGGWFVQGTNASTSAPSSGVYEIGVTGIESGYGYAPIGAAVTVTSAVPILINVSGTISLKAGYTLSTEREAVANALQRYFDSLGIGDDVVFRKIQSVFFDSPGIGDVASLFLSAPDLSISNSTNDITLDALTDPEIARLGTVSLSVAP